MRSVIKIIVATGCLLLVIGSCRSNQFDFDPPAVRGISHLIFDQENNQVNSGAELTLSTVWLEPWLSFGFEDRGYSGNPIQKHEISFGSKWIDNSERFWEVDAFSHGVPNNEDRIELQLPGPGTYSINTRATFWGGEVLYADHSTTLTILPAEE